MNKKLTGILIGIFLCVSAFSQSTQEEKTLPLSLEDCIVKAMENNLGVAIEVLNPQLSDIRVDSAKEKFLPQMSFNFSRQDQNNPSYSFLEAADQVKTEMNRYSTQINQLIPTGGSFSLSIDGSMYDTNRRFTTVNPRYNTTLRFEFSQPLLKDFGLKTTRKDIIVAQNNRNISENQLRRSLQETVYNVEQAYWNLVYSIENLKVKKQSLKLAKELLEKNKKAVEVGSMAPIEILNAQAEVAARKADILQAEATVKNNQDALKTLLNLSAEKKDAAAIQIKPVEKPEYELKEITLEEAISTALENRPDLQATRIDLKNKQTNVSYAKNQLLPDLSLNASYWSPGISGDRIIYDPNDPFGPPIGQIEGGYAEAFEDAFGFTYQNWSVSLSLSVPFNTFFSRAALAQARINLDQAKLQLQNQRKQIYLDIKNAVRAVQTNYERVQAYQASRKLAEKKLEAEEEKLRVGISTNYLLLQYQRDLANQQIAELQAIIDYNLSLAQLNKAMGSSLEDKNIKMSSVIERQ
ncbi:TolC family protein [bacterium]|nr:TolC family protein [bacterium]